VLILARQFMPPNGSAWPRTFCLTKPILRGVEHRRAMAFSFDRGAIRHAPFFGESSIRGYPEI
jgi:hypothetical protein